jgi:hypothetical protein
MSPGDSTFRDSRSPRSRSFCGACHTVSAKKPYLYAMLSVHSPGRTV